MKMTEDENNVVEENVADDNVIETDETANNEAESKETANNVPEVDVTVPNMAEPTIVENIGLENQVVDDNINDDNESAEEMLENVYRILIVDDEKEVLHALRRTLLYAKQFKSEIKTVENAETALEEIEKRDIDLILCDYRMPGMTGTQFLQKVRDKYPDIVRIIVTGFSDIEIIKEAINKAEIHYYIEKPWINEQVRTIVYEALKRKAKRESDKIGHSKEKFMMM
jgi:FixJ family two-component response regulator